MLNSKSVHVLHLLLIGPYLTYIGLTGKKCSQMCFNVMTGVGIFVMVYHAYGLYLDMNREVSVTGIGNAVKNTINNIGGQFLGKDNQGNNVVADDDGNVAVVDEAGNVVAANNNKALESANQAMMNNNAANNAGNNVANNAGNNVGNNA